MVKNFRCFTSLPSFHKKRLRLPAFTSFHCIHMQKLAQKLLQLWSNPWKTWKYFTMNNKQYAVLGTWPSNHGYIRRLKVSGFPCSLHKPSETWPSNHNRIRGLTVWNFPCSLRKFLRVWWSDKNCSVWVSIFVMQIFENETIQPQSHQLLIYVTLTQACLNYANPLKPLVSNSIIL